MTLKKFYPYATAFALSVVLSACGSDSSVNTDNAATSQPADEEVVASVSDVSDDAEESASQKSKRLAAEGCEESCDEEFEAQETENQGVDGQNDAPESSSSEPVDNYAICMESSTCVDSVFNILFPDGIEGIDTARHEPDSVGVWHFYDPRGTHDNPDFAYGEMTDPRDGIVYKTTTIGGVVWMAENLNYFDIEGAPSSIKNDWCYWDKPENCESAGRLYTWKVAKRVCPEGWHLPTNDDWTALLTAVGADTLNPIAWKGANVLKSKSGWENSGSGTDDFGFTALPAGRKFFTKVQDGFTNHGCSAYMWSATEPDIAAGADTLAFSLELNCSNENAMVNTFKKTEGLSVRCVKD